MHKKVHIVLCEYCVWCCAHVGYAVLSTDVVMYMLEMQCYVQVVLCEFCTCGAMYIWCGVHDCTNGVVCMWCCVHVVQVTLCASGAVYMSYMWRCVHVVSNTCRVCGTMYMWYYVQVV